ncbi:related to PBS2 - tyrosine protein kinase of the MAP kinase kinase family [Ustilago trichophora]|uniref:mitogen-activated protein kinase kinase n=1 Tax=Ustilago trichophora TaxID=86804 RepID=A0A5C3E7I8_9BASI|nr:related to PBS2 - tyrosine protein kinase of the MAP kinase kinase family [Ustilago trichophora]
MTNSVSQGEMERLTAQMSLKDAPSPSYNLKVRRWPTSAFLAIHCISASVLHKALVAKLAANANRSTMSGSPNPGVMGTISASTAMPVLLFRKRRQPSGTLPGTGMGGLAARRGVPGALGAPSAGGPPQQPAQAQVQLQSTTTGASLRRSWLQQGTDGAGQQNGAMSTPFSNFSKIVDPSGRLNFSGKAVLHASGVEFGNGTSFKINMAELELMDELGRAITERYASQAYTDPRRDGHEGIRLELDESKLNAIIMELDILTEPLHPRSSSFTAPFSSSRAVPEDVLARITGSMVRGLSFLKDHLQIMHRDVKPTNVLINRKGQVKLCDFGVSGQLEKSLAKTNIGCQSYMAPERIKGESQNMLGTYTVASDVWSLGLSMVETTLGTYPYPPETYSNVFAQLQAIVHGDPPELPSDLYSETARDFVAKCLEKIPSRRPTYAQLLQHDFLTQDEAKGENGVDMVGWVDRAMDARAKKKEQQQQTNGTSSNSSTPSPAA